MSVARVLIRQKDMVYRFLKLETSSDGSLLIFLDRDPRPETGGMRTAEDGTFILDETASDVAASSAKYSVHTTGEVRRYTGDKWKNTIYIKPLHSITKVFSFGFISIPEISKLDSLIKLSIGTMSKPCWI